MTDAKIVWISSSSASPSLFSLDDMQGIYTRHSYESSKHTTNLLVKALQKTNKRVYNCNPGAVATNITNGLAPVWLIALVLYCLRIFCVRELNIDATNATTAIATVCFGEEEGEEGIQFVSDCDWRGNAFVRKRVLDLDDRDSRYVMKQLDELAMIF